MRLEDELRQIQVEWRKNPGENANPLARISRQLSDILYLMASNFDVLELDIQEVEELNKRLKGFMFYALQDDLEGRREGATWLPPFLETLQSKNATVRDQVEPLRRLAARKSEELLRIANVTGPLSLLVDSHYQALLRALPRTLVRGAEANSSFAALRRKRDDFFEESAGVENLQRYLTLLEELSPLIDRSPLAESAGIPLEDLPLRRPEELERLEEKLYAHLLMDSRAE